MGTPAMSRRARAARPPAPAAPTEPGTRLIQLSPLQQQVIAPHYDAYQQARVRLLEMLVVATGLDPNATPLDYDPRTGQVVVLPGPGGAPTAADGAVGAAGNAKEPDAA
jgi:hypothetical protein